MNLKDQVLSIEQVRELQELQELGFNINKHSSLKSNGKQIIVQDDFYIGGAPLFPTMSIGDIIEVLPPHIHPRIYHKKYGEEIEQTHILIMYLYGNFGCLICYKHSLQHTFVFESREKSYIKALFETLKWCIKEKHIAL